MQAGAACGDAGRQQSEVSELAGADGQRVLNLLGVDDLADFGLGRLDLGNFGGYRDLLSLRGDFQRHVNCGGLADGEDDALVYVGCEALKRDGQIVPTRGQVGKRVESGVVGGGVVLRVGGSFLQGRVAPLTAAPLSSRTEPPNWAPVICAKAEPAKDKKNATNRTARRAKRALMAHPLADINLKAESSASTRVMGRMFKAGLGTLSRLINRADVRDIGREKMFRVHAMP